MSIVIPGSVGEYAPYQKQRLSAQDTEIEVSGILTGNETVGGVAVPLPTMLTCAHSIYRGCSEIYKWKALNSLKDAYIELGTGIARRSV